VTDDGRRATAPHQLRKVFQLCRRDVCSRTIEHRVDAAPEPQRTGRRSKCIVVA
jgi:hypothetical protein